MMVDSKYQGKGHGTVALRLYLQQLSVFVWLRENSLLPTLAICK
jgi:hypothetical protein